MFSEKFKKQSPKLVEYFENLLKNDSKKLPPSLIFYGLDANEQYEFALNLARILNCENDGQYDCNCRNCNWIKTNKHPSVVTCTNLDSKNKQKTNISIDQIKEIISSILISSDYKRFFIFTGATNDYPSVKSDFAPPSEKNWRAIPLDFKILNDVASNALLKSIEEPTENTYFIFLTRDKNDLLQTIISRSQSFYIPLKTEEIKLTSDFCELFNKYPFNTFEEICDFVEDIKIWQVDNSVEFLDVLKYMQIYLQRLYVHNYTNDVIKKDIVTLEKSIKQFKSEIKDYIIYENICYELEENRK